MDFANERYVRLYTRDTTTWKLLCWQARTVLMHLLRKVDRSGVLEVGEDGVDGLAAVLELPLEIVQVGAESLIRRTIIRQTRTAFVLLKFIEAQETRQSDPQRARDSRERRRADSLRNSQDDKTPEPALENVTRGHIASQDVTPIRSEPSELSEPAEPSSASGAREPRRPQSKAVEFPESFELTEKLEAFARAHGVTDVPAELEAFRDHHKAKGSRMKDWAAAFRTWCRNRERFGGRKTSGPPANAERARAETRAMLASFDHEAARQERDELERRRRAEREQQASRFGRG